MPWRPLWRFRRDRNRYFASLSFLVLKGTFIPGHKRKSLNQKEAKEKVRSHQSKPQSWSSPSLPFVVFVITTRLRWQLVQNSCKESGLKIAVSRLEIQSFSKKTWSKLSADCTTVEREWKRERERARSGKSRITNPWWRDGECLRELLKPEESERERGRVWCESAPTLVRLDQRSRDEQGEEESEMKRKKRRKVML